MSAYNVGNSLKREHGIPQRVPPYTTRHTGTHLYGPHSSPL